MTEPKWTKGPWAEHGRGGCSCGLIFGPDGNACIAMAYGPSHLGIDGPDCVPNAAAQVANARLITAAHDLYAACDAQHKAIDALMARLIVLDPDFRPTKSAAWPAVEQGFAALAKARGEIEARAEGGAS